MKRHRINYIHNNGLFNTFEVKQTCKCFQRNNKILIQNDKLSFLWQSKKMAALKIILSLVFFNCKIKNNNRGHI